MTEPTALPEIAQDAADPAVPIHPSDMLLDFIVTFLAPMFLGVSGGDIGFARMAALETVSAYRAANQADLIAIAQIIACGLTALGSLSLSMADNLSLSMTLRLRGNAVALDRAAEHNRRALKQLRRADAPRLQPLDGVQADLPPAQTAYEAEVVAGVVAAQARVAQARADEAQAAQTQTAQIQTAQTQVAQTQTAQIQTAQTQAAQTRAAPVRAPLQAVTPAAAIRTGAQPVAPPADPTAARGGPAAADPAGLTQRQWQSMWAAAMTEVAGEFTADLKHLPPDARRAASCRAAALSSCANQLLLGELPPPPKPGDLTAIIRPNPT